MSTADSTPAARLRVSETKLQRCDTCAEPFVVRYRLEGLIADPGGGRVHLRTDWVHCPRPRCRRWQPVLVPAWAFDLRTKEWLGLRSATPTGPTWYAVLSTRPGREGPSEPTAAGPAPRHASGWLARLARRLRRSP